MKNQKLAMLGLGGRATLFYLRQINERYQQITQTNAVCPLVLKKTNFDNINNLLPDQFFQLESIVNKELSCLKMANNVILPNITLHETVDRLNGRVGVNYPVIHPLRLVVEKLRSNECKQVMIIASKYSMNSKYMHEYFAKNNILVTTPNQREQDQLDDYRKKVYSFKEAEADTKAYFALLSKLRQQHTVVTACTELSLVLPAEDNGLYDMSRLQIEEAMKVYLN